MLVTSQTPAYAIKAFSPWKARKIEASFKKGISGEATLFVQKEFVLTDSKTLQLQSGELVDTPEFFGAPRCYFHFKKEFPGTKILSPGVVLKISTIDNIYSNGSVHVRFWFEENSDATDLSCVTNYDHTLTLSELRTTLGNHIRISLTQSVEKEALFNSVPHIKAPTLSESEPSQHPLHAMRFILGS